MFLRTKILENLIENILENKSLGKLDCEFSWECPWE